MPRTTRTVMLAIAIVVLLVTTGQAQQRGRGGNACKLAAAIAACDQGPRQHG